MKTSITSPFSDELNKDLDATNENLEKAEQTSGENKQAIGSLEDQLRELAERNKVLGDELDQYKRDTDRVGSANSDRNDQNYMNSESIFFLVFTFTHKIM